jgi:hypothetical protein
MVTREANQWHVNGRCCRQQYFRSAILCNVCNVSRWLSDNEGNCTCGTHVQIEHKCNTPYVRRLPHSAAPPRLLLLLLLYCPTAAPLLRHCGPNASPLLPLLPYCCCSTAALLLPYCCPTAVPLLPYCCLTAALLLPHCCPTAAPLRPHCFPTGAAAALLLL